jgi:hypothetical protein
MTHLSHPHPEAEASARQPAKTKFGFISSMWEMEDDARRVAIIRRASRGATRTLGKARDVIVIEPSLPTALKLDLTIPSGAPQWKRIILETAIAHGVPPVDIMSARRAAPIVAARQEAMWRMRMETTMSTPAIGKRLGGRDHTTVIHGVRKHAERMEAKNAARTE